MQTLNWLASRKVQQRESVDKEMKVLLCILLYIKVKRIIGKNKDKGAIYQKIFLFFLAI